MYFPENLLFKYKNVWVTSDWHFNHRKIIEFEQVRGSRFSDVNAMNKALVELWNSVVGDNDLVINLGDLSFSYTETIESQLRGKKILIRGNHDMRSDEYYRNFGYIRCPSVAVWNDLVFTHIPIHPNEFIGRWRVNIHGHTHSRRIDDPRYFNACLDAHPNFSMWNLTEILDTLEKKE